MRFPIRLFGVAATVLAVVAVDLSATSGIAAPTAPTATPVPGVAGQDFKLTAGPAPSAHKPTPVVTEAVRAAVATPPAPVLPRVSRAQILSSLVASPAGYRRLDRKEARLAMKVDYDDWLASIGGPKSTAYANPIPPQTLVWATAVSGDILPMSFSPVPPASWEVTVWDADTGRFISNWYSSKGTWPDRWTALPDWG